MRSKLLAASLTGLALGLAWVAAPALSLLPYQPPAVDFEQALPAASRLADRASALRAGADVNEHGARWISPVISAPHRFDLVGIAGEVRPAEFRVRDEEGGWSDWVESSNGDPVYAGGADQVQVRAAFRPAGRLHYVNVSGTAGGPADRLLTGARSAINSAFVSIASSPVAEAVAPRPKFVSRARWGANREEGGCPPRTTPAYGSVRSGVIHHTVTANRYGSEEGPRIVLGICRYHVYANGWNDIGYQALVDRFGRVYTGRGGGINRAVVGAQAQGFNSETAGIASIGTHTSSAVPRRARRGIVRYLAWKLKLHGAVPATGRTELTSAGGEATSYPAGRVIRPFRVIGHRRLNRTACPGDSLFRQVASIRKQVQRRISRFAERRPG